ncbi:MAG TPA: terminase gpA endonuclease subunit, partial [Oligoflexus sp.]|uniref:terminase gpA endonuclease subunit n=1 Tax=Oligoflexus sp. TaxID=1971216 RepID=UPI002D586200
GRDGDSDFYVGTPSQIDVENDGRRTKYGLKVHPVGTHVIKSELFGWLRLHPNSDGAYPPGYCHFPIGHSQEYFMELTAEEIDVETDSKGRDKLVFRKTRKRNEALDCRVYARAMAYMEGLDAMTETQWNVRDALFEGENEK